MKQKEDLLICSFPQMKIVMIGVVIISGNAVVMVVAVVVGSRRKWTARWWNIAVGFTIDDE